MEQWFDDTLVAIEQNKRTKKFRVVELPARCTEAQTVTNKELLTEEQAEKWISANYDLLVVRVYPEDIQEEIERRQIILAKTN